jgi:hypothetical protein
MAVAGARLGSILNATNLSAQGLASAVGHLAGPTAFAALAVTILNVINALEEYKKISDDVTRTIDAMQTSARDARGDVARLLGEAPAQSAAVRAVNILRDAVAKMRAEAARIGGAAGTEINRQADALDRDVAGIGKRASLIPAREAAKSLAEYNRHIVRQSQLLDLLNAGPMEELDSTLGLMRKRLEALVEGGKAQSQEAQTLAAALGIGTHRLAEMKRAAQLMTSGLTMLADTMAPHPLRTSSTTFSDSCIATPLIALSRALCGALLGGARRRRVGAPSK